MVQAGKSKCYDRHQRRICQAQIPWRKRGRQKAGGKKAEGRGKGGRSGCLQYSDFRTPRFAFSVSSGFSGVSSVDGSEQRHGFPGGKGLDSHRIAGRDRSPLGKKRDLSRRGGRQREGHGHRSAYGSRKWPGRNQNGGRQCPPAMGCRPHPSRGRP